MKKIKIVHVQLLPLLSGVQVMMLNLLECLDKDRYDIYVISKPGGDLVAKVKECGYRYIPVGSLRRNLSPLDIVAFFKLLTIFKKHQFDIVHTHSSKTGLLGRIAARLAGTKKIIHTVHGFPFHQHQSLIGQKLYRCLERIAARFCDYIVVVNQFEREQAVASKLLPLEKLLTIYNGIKTDPQVYPKQYTSFRKIDADRLADLLQNCRGGLAYKTIYQEPKIPAERSFNNQHNVITLTPQSFIIGTVARFTPAKNIVKLMEVAAKVCQQNFDIIFLFIGDGELFKPCREIVEKKRLQERIILTGWQRNTKEWLDIMDVFLLYSLWEGLSISILEAMAQGLPIIASDIKGNNELVTADNGLLINLKDNEQLEKTLISLPQRQEELSLWSKGSLRRVQEKFGYQAFCEAYEKLYRQQ